MKVGFLLGSFDPIHMGHLHMAAAVLNCELVDEVVFVPSVQNPWKTDSTDFRNRCFMIQLAIDDMERCSLSSIDYRNTEPYYSVNTLKMLQEEYPEDELYLIVGADIVNSIKDWHEGEWILENFNLITIARQGSEAEAVIKKTINVSSTEIRTLISDGKQIYPLVPKVIAQYIKRYNLYKK
jgi:nicotinate-nucleotide adenylyltransferase